MSWDQRFADPIVLPARASLREAVADLGKAIPKTAHDMPLVTTAAELFPLACMRKQTVLAKKKRGPPPTGKSVQVFVRLRPAPLNASDAWASKQDNQPPRAEAIRRLIELGLKVRPPR